MGDVERARHHRFFKSMHTNLDLLGEARRDVLLRGVVCQIQSDLDANFLDNVLPGCWEGLCDTTCGA